MALRPLGFHHYLSPLPPPTHTRNFLQIPLLGQSFTEPHLLTQPLQAPSPLGNLLQASPLSSKRFQEDWDFSWSISDNPPDENTEQGFVTSTDVGDVGKGVARLQISEDAIPSGIPTLNASLKPLGHSKPLGHTSEPLIPQFLTDSVNTNTVAEPVNTDASPPNIASPTPEIIQGKLTPEATLANPPAPTGFTKQAEGNYQDAIHSTPLNIQQQSELTDIQSVESPLLQPRLNNDNTDVVIIEQAQQVTHSQLEDTIIPYPKTSAPVVEQEQPQLNVQTPSEQSFTQPLIQREEQTTLNTSEQTTETGAITSAFLKTQLTQYSPNSVAETYTEVNLSTQETAQQSNLIKPDLENTATLNDEVQAVTPNVNPTQPLIQQQVESNLNLKQTDATKLESQVVQAKWEESSEEVTPPSSHLNTLIQKLAIAPTPELLPGNEVPNKTTGIIEPTLDARDTTPTNAIDVQTTVSDEDVSQHIYKSTSVPTPPKHSDEIRISQSNAIQPRIDSQTLEADDEITYPLAQASVKADLENATTTEKPQTPTLQRSPQPSPPLEKVDEQFSQQVSLSEPPSSALIPDEEIPSVEPKVIQAKVNPPTSSLEPFPVQTQQQPAIPTPTKSLQQRHLPASQEATREDIPTQQRFEIPQLPQLKPLGLSESVALTSDFITPKFSEELPESTPSLTQTNQDEHSVINPIDSAEYFDNLAVHSSPLSPTEQPKSTPDTWSNITELLGNSIATKPDREAWEEQFNFQSPVTEELISPWVNDTSPASTEENSGVSPGETLVNPLATLDSSSLSQQSANQQTNNNVVDEEQFELLAQTVYRLIRFQFSIETERQSHVLTGHLPWLDVINYSNGQGTNTLSNDIIKSENKQIQASYFAPPIEHKLALLIQEVYRTIKIRLEISKERAGIFHISR